MGTTERLVVDLPSDLVTAVRNAVRSGAFASESKVLEAILRAWRGDDGVEEPDIETVRAFVAEGIADADAGRFVDADEMFERLRARLISARPETRTDEHG
jgi:Arc/MetJ-type ribon-helix-helix transcriptional regulator